MTNTSTIIFFIWEGCFLLKENDSKKLEAFYHKHKGQKNYTDIRKTACRNLENKEGVIIDPKDLKFKGIIDIDDTESIFVYTHEHTHELSKLSKSYIWSRFVESSNKLDERTKKIIRSIVTNKPLPNLNKKQVLELVCY